MEPADHIAERRHRVLRHGLGRELPATFALAAPFAAANLAQMAMGVTNTVLVGRLGRYRSLPLGSAECSISLLAS